MVSISSRKGSTSLKNLSRCVFLLILGLFLLGTVEHIHNYWSIEKTEIRYQKTDIEMTEVEIKKSLPDIISWEQLEENMERIDPEKAKQWKKFLEQEKTDRSRSTTEDQKISLESLEDERVKVNSERVRVWRQEFEAAAAIENPEQHRSKTKEYAMNGFVVQNLKECKYIMIDFGSNVGDSLRKMIDSSFPEFDSGVSKNGEKLHPVLNTTSGSVGNVFYDFGGRKNPNKWILPKWVRNNIAAYNRWSKKPEDEFVYPEDYCFYGVEGNPHFTPVLQKEEIQIMNMVPRPVRHVHFLTEHVGAGIDGPTTLYLDTVNKKDNFWGSSVYNTHKDVVSSGGNTGVPVMGITLTRLLKETVIPGGHVMIKIDIEGGEYQLLEEAINSNILCDLIKEKGVKIDMLNEVGH